MQIKTPFHKIKIGLLSKFANGGVSEGMKLIFMSALAVLAFASTEVGIAQSIYPGQHTGKLKVETSVPVKALSFDLRDVRLLPGRVHDNLRAHLLNLQFKEQRI